MLSSKLFKELPLATDKRKYLTLKCMQTDHTCEPRFTSLNLEILTVK